MGHRIVVVTNFSQSLKQILKFCEIAGENLLHFHASLHLEQADQKEFLKKAILVKRFIGSKFSVLSVARPGWALKLKNTGQIFRNQGIPFFMLLERGYDENFGESFAKYDKQELNIIKDFRRDFYHKDFLRFKGRLCWAGSKYFVVDERGEAWRCYPARQHKDPEGYLGNLLRGTFKLNKRPAICRYKYCSCVTPIQLGMIIDNSLATDRIIMKSYNKEMYKLVVSKNKIKEK